MADTFAYRLALALGYNATTNLCDNVVIPGESPAQKVPCHLYTYKSADPKGEILRFLRPMIHVAVPKQFGRAGVAGYPQNYSPYQATVEYTSLAIYVEAPQYFTTASGKVRGGFDAIHHPLILAVRAFIHSNLTLGIPANLHSLWRDGTVGLRRDDPNDESPYSPPEGGGIGHAFFVQLYEYGRV